MSRRRPWCGLSPAGLSPRASPPRIAVKRYPSLLRSGTFVAAQLRAELAYAESRPRLYHLRQEQGRREIDLIAELGARRIVGLEVEADSAPDREAARHLAWLRDQLGERFVAGVVLHTGARVYDLDDRIVAAPICTLWA